MPHRKLRDRTQVLPFPQATDLHLRIARSFALITDWNAALAGHYAVSDVLQILTKQTEARNIALCRLAGDRVLPIAATARPYDAGLPERSSGRLMRYLIETRFPDLQPGMIIGLSQLAREDGFRASPAAREWAARPEIVEVSLIVLEVTRDQVDFIEMTFDTRPRPSRELPVSIVTQAMADAWSVRAPGLIARLIRTYGRTRAAQPAQQSVDVLSTDNPFALSRAEQRVAQLLVTGAKPRDIAEALEVSIPTVRSHLRNLYAKTETGGQVELVALITASRAAA